MEHQVGIGLANHLRHVPLPGRALSTVAHHNEWDRAGPAQRLEAGWIRAKHACLRFGLHPIKITLPWGEVRQSQQVVGHWLSGEAPLIQIGGNAVKHGGIAGDGRSPKNLNTIGGAVLNEWTSYKICQ